MKIGILGASGAVGRQMIQCLEERQLPIEEIRFFGFGSVGQEITFKDRGYKIEKPYFNGLDVILGAVSSDIAKGYITDIKASGALFIDNSSAFRHDAEVPLVVPQINKEDIVNHHGIIANPNCSTIITLMAVQAINKLSPVTAINAVTYQAVSGAGAKGLEELNAETVAFCQDGKVERKSDVFNYPILFNCIPQIGDIGSDGYTSEELKMEKEARKIMHIADLKVNCTCVRVPVTRSHSIAVTVYTKDRLELTQVEAAFSNSEGLIYLKNDLPMPLVATDRDEVFVGRLRKDRIFANGITFFVCGDQIRKGAATNAIEILEHFLKL